MARFNDEIIEKLKNEISLVRLLESQGHKLKKQGKDYLCHCPFHNDKTPSLVVSPDKNLWHCLGACGEGGSVIDWVMKREGISFKRAVEILQHDLGVLTVEHKPSQKLVKKSTSKQLSSPLMSTDGRYSGVPGGSTSVTDKQDDQALLQRVINFYHETLKQSPEALEYLESRGLNNVELIETFKLGYANRSLGYRLPEKTRKAGAEIRGQLQSIGIYRESGHEHFSGSLVVPIIREDGIVTETYGRKIGNRLRKGTPHHLYLPGVHEGVWNEEALTASSEIILCESLIDAMTFWVHGFKNVTSAYGINGFTFEILKALVDNQVKRVLIAYDRDEAGNKAAKELAKNLQAVGMECYRVQFPKGMDANEYALKMSPPRKSLELVIRKAQWMGVGAEPERNEKSTNTVMNKPKSKEAAKEQTLNSEQIISLAAETPLPASPKPPIPSSDIEAEVSENEVVMMFGSRRYRVRGLKKNLSYEQLKVNLLVSNGETMHVDTLELYQAKQRQSFIKQSSIELGVMDEVIKKDLAKVLLKLEQLQDEQIQISIKPKEQKLEISHEEKEQALALLKNPDLLGQILDDFNRAGVVGEQTNKLVGYLAAVSRKLDNPLAVLIQSTSAAGKSALMNAVLAMVPEEECIQYSAMTGQSLFYMGETNLKHKILSIAEEEGAENASYALKLLQSEGELTMASTGKDSEGNLTTQEYRVEGPVMLFSTTTAIDIDEELMNRCLVLSVNESREQTQLIHQMQRRKRTLKGLEDKTEKKRILTIHQNAQRLLKSLHIVNPYADQLTFLDDKTRTRRDHEKYLSLIDAITLLHQYQRTIKQTQFNGEILDYIEVMLEDIEIANRLAHEVLGRSLDELPPQTRKLLKHIQQMVLDGCKQNQMDQNDFRFSRKQIREFTGWSDNQLKVHCHRLEEMEYLLVHRGSRGKSLDYELLFAGDLNQEQPQLMGLIDTTNLKKQGYDVQKLGQSQQKLVPSCPQVGAKLASSWGDENGLEPLNTRSKDKNQGINGKTHKTDENIDLQNHRHNSIPLAAQTASTELM